MTVMRINILCDLEVLRAGEPVESLGATASTMLGHLAVHAGEPVSAARLLDRLRLGPGEFHHWRRLQRPADEIHDVLDDGPSGVRLERIGGGACFRLRVPPDGTDLLQSRRLVREGRAAADRSLHHVALESLDRADALWRGELLGGRAPAASWPEAGALAAERELLREDLLTSRLALNESLDEVADELWCLVEKDPGRETWPALLIEVLSRLGRTAEAEAVYRAAVDTLAERWGLDPGPELQRQMHRLEARRGAGSEEGAEAGDVDVAIVVISRLGAAGPDAPPPAETDEGHAHTDDELLHRMVVGHGGTIVWRIAPVVMALFVGRGHSERALHAACSLMASRRRRGHEGDSRISIRSGMADRVMIANAVDPGRTGIVLSGKALFEGREQFFRSDPGVITVDDATVGAARSLARFEPVASGGHRVLPPEAPSRDEDEPVR